MLWLVQFKLPNFIKIHPMFHVSLLEFYHTFTIPRRIHDPLSLIEVDGEYEMEDILDSRISNRQFQYLVHWHEYDASKHTWEQSKTYQMPWKRFTSFVDDI
jgi:hypothetical protein